MCFEMCRFKKIQVWCANKVLSEVLELCSIQDIATCIMFALFVQWNMRSCHYNRNKRNDIFQNYLSQWVTWIYYLEANDWVLCKLKGLKAGLEGLGSGDFVEYRENPRICRAPEAIKKRGRFVKLQLFSKYPYR